MKSFDYHHTISPVNNVIHNVIIMNVGQTRSFVEIEIDQNLWTIGYGLIRSVHRFV